MENKEFDKTQSVPPEATRPSRISYEPPELIAYIPSEITMGGSTKKTGSDFVPGGGTSYFS